MRRLACSSSTSLFSGRLAAAAAALGLLVALPAGSIPTTVTSSDFPECDSLAVPESVDELGFSPTFPADEEIAAGEIGFGPPSCPSTDFVAIPDLVVGMVNLTTFDFVEVWYVADLETTISNADGFVNDGLAFRIDAVGANTPLLFESLTPDGIFEAGEEWHFVIQDYFNGFGLPASLFGSVGVGGFSIPGSSSGSIIAIVPEPTTGLLVTLGLAGLAVRRGRARAA